MKLERTWISPIMAGGFLLIAVTGVVLFFHVSTSFAKWSHEWLGMALIIFAIAHAILNWRPLKLQITTKIGAALFILLSITTIASLIPFGDSSGSAPPFIAPINALSNQPIAVLAELSNHSEQEVMEILSSQGIVASSSTQTLSELTEGNTGRNMGALGKVFQSN